MNLMNWNPSGRGLQKMRAFGNSVILPDATVLFIGGINKAGGGPDSLATLETEIYDHYTDGNKWTVATNLIYPRNYHSVALLLYDGRVLVAGSDIDGQRGDQSRNLNIEIYTPDNLWRGPRPEFSVDAEQVQAGGTLNIALKKDWRWEHLNPERIGLIRCCSCTHGFSQDQRYVGLKSNGAIGSSEFSIYVPANSNIVPPGYYYLFLVSKSGTPSVSTIIQITL